MSVRHIGNRRNPVTLVSCRHYPRIDRKRNRSAYMREYRARKRRSEQGERSDTIGRQREEAGDDEVDRLAKWAKRVLRVPAGHPLAGHPMEIPEFGVDFLRDALQHRESLLCLGRRTRRAPSSRCTSWVRMVGPLFVPGWRGAVASVNKEKAGELKRQMQEIAEASGLQGLTFLRSPAPGRVEASDCELAVLSADASSGHAAGFDDVVIDETGLLQERDRGLVNGLR